MEDLNNNEAPKYSVAPIDNLLKAMDNFVVPSAETEEKNLKNIPRHIR